MYIPSSFRAVHFVLFLSDSPAEVAPSFVDRGRLLRTVQSYARRACNSTLRGFASLSILLTVCWFYTVAN